ncbi:MAG: hypothetical protein MUO94_03585 [Thermoplasmata archaeon]|nr:hypothetical protein [Thermoplasmata archaeon]
MKRRFANMHVRALCHASEDIERVERAVLNLVGDRDLSVTATKGHHGNEILLVEATIQDSAGIEEVVGKLGQEDLRKVLATLEDRMDDSNNLFLRLDKQASYAGETKLATGDDVVSVRLHVNAYPAKREIAISTATAFIEALIEGQGARTDSAGSIG